MEPLRMMTYNVRHLKGMDGRIDAERVGEIIAEQRPAVLALQELDRGTTRSGGADQAASLAEVTGLDIRFHRTVGWPGGGDYGIGFGTAEETDQTYVPLPRVGEEEPRAAVVARTEGITFISTHLDFRAHVAAIQMKALADLAREVEPPVVVLGDLNQRRGKLEALRNFGFDAGPRRVTFPGPPPRQIDYILAGPGLSIAQLSTIKSRASDHYPLIATLVPAGSEPT